MSIFPSIVQNTVQARSLWIGDIEYWMDEGFVTNFFQDVANVKNLKIIRDKLNSKGLGYGFVEFESAEMAKLVLDELNGKAIPDTNKILKLNWASYSAGKQIAMSNAPVTDYSIYVGELEPSITEDRLRDFFLKYYSSVIGTKIIVDPVNKLSKGYGFVKFSDQQECNKALHEMNGKYFGGKPIKTNQASFKKMNSDTNLINNIPNNNVSGNFSQYNLSYNNYSSEQNGFNQTSNNSNVFSYNHSHNQNQNYGSSNSGNSKYQSYNGINQNGLLLNNSQQQNNSNNYTLINLNNFYTRNIMPEYTGNSKPVGGSFNHSNFYYNNFQNNAYYSQVYGNYFPQNNYNYQNNQNIPGSNTNQVNASSIGNYYFGNNTGYESHYNK